MSTQTSRLSGEAPSTQTTFSYAQAAKGRATSNTNATLQSSQTTSGTNTPAKDASSAAVSVNGSTAEVAEHIANGTQDLGKGENISTVRSDSSESRLTAVNTAPTSPSVGSASTSTIPKEDSLNLANNTAIEGAWEKEPQASGGMDKHSEADDGRKGRKGKKGKNAEKEAEKAKVEEPKVYVAAAPPAVNFWQQRQEAQAAKAKTAPVVDWNQPSDVGDAATSLKKKGSKPADEGVSSAGLREASSAIRAQKKGPDGFSRGKDEISTKRPPRGSRLGEKDEKAVQLPPPVEDSTSWPTPEIALEEGKRKAQEKVEKDDKDKENGDNTTNKPRPKEKWVPVPYIPTVTFSTPLPSRGGRGRGGGRGGRESGGRGGHAANNGATGEKGSNASGALESKERGRDTATNGRTNSLPPNSSKRPSSNGPYGARDQRKPLATATTRSGPPSTNKSDANATENRTSSTVVQAENAQNDQDISRSETLKGAKSEHTQAVNGESHQHNRSATDRRGEPNFRGADQFKDGSNFTKDPSHQTRDRTEGRPDRGRGNFRGRGSHNFANGHNFTNGHGSQPGGAYQPRQNSGPYSPPLQQPPFQNSFGQGSSRGGRGAGRSQSIPNGSMYSRYPPSSNSGAQITPVQTSGPVFDYQPIPPHMNAIPFNSFIDQYSVLAMVTMQLEYYFSIDNLCKDVYLRKHMDSQGFVFLSFIAGFKRIQALTQDFELLRFACQESELIDIIKGEDGVDRLRRQEGWEKWVFAMEDRDESVRNAGPTQHFRQPSQRSQSMGQLVMPGQHLMSPQAFSPNGTGPYGNGLAVAPASSTNGHAYPVDTPLSAAVPDFAPGYQQTNGSPDPLEAETTFTDEEVENLTVVFASAKASSDSKQVPYHNASARTFSNGSIDGRSIEGIEESRQGRPLTNGSHSSETSPEQSNKTDGGNPPPVMWVKGQKQQALVSEHNTRESYIAVRARALKHRELSQPGETHPDMKLLYEFWAHFLCRNFNPKMYYEFRTYAFEDAEQKRSVGMENLITYYDEILNSKKKTIPETLARHYVELVKGEESNSERPGFAKLRAAWRNGALDMKSRKKVDNLVDAKLRAELER